LLNNKEAGLIFLPVFQGSAKFPALLKFFVLA